MHNSHDFHVTTSKNILSGRDLNEPLLPNRSNSTPPRSGDIHETEIVSDRPLSSYSSIQSPDNQSNLLKINQLLTPQSHGPTTSVAYFTHKAYPESPSDYAINNRTNGIIASGSTRILPKSGITKPEESRQALAWRSARIQMATPDASPPVPLSTISESPNSQSASSSDPQIRMKVEDAIPALAPAHDITPSRIILSRASSPFTQSCETALSSPFVERSERSVVEQQAPRALQVGESVSQGSGLVDVGRLPLPDVLPSQKIVTLYEPSRELEHLREQFSSMERARLADIENRRPDYLRRVQRDAASKKQNNASGDLGIATTPLKGRRLQLFDFQQTSDESFEESLMTHGYGTYGETRTPQRPLMATEGLSKEALDWLAYNTPVAAVNSSAVSSNVHSEREIKKRKRLDAFTRVQARTQLYPTEIEGLGRVIMNIPPEKNVPDIPPNPTRKRLLGKRKRGALDKDKEKTPEAELEVKKEPTEPRWLDDQYPWCLPGKEREEESRRLVADRMKLLENYLGYDSESDDESNLLNYDPFTPHNQSLDEPGLGIGGRGKTVTVSRNPKRKKVPSAKSHARSMKFLSESADAREALCSRRSTRLLTYRLLTENGYKRASRNGVNDGRLACICGNNETDDGLPSVQCEDCYDWFHLKCIGVNDVEDLGEPDDPWFCPSCMKRINSSVFNWQAQRQPIFVPTDEKLADTRRDDAFNSSSPLGEWGSSGTLKTPVEYNESRRASNPSIWDDQSGSVKGLGHDKEGYELGYTFDPNASPERMFPGRKKIFTTPKNSSIGFGVGSLGSVGFGMPWSMRSGGLFSTPTPQELAAKSLYISDETPISRTPRGETERIEGRVLSFPPTASACGSPLSGKGKQSARVSLQNERLEALK